MAENNVILELKAEESLNTIYEARAITYLKLTGMKLCPIINFNVRPLRDGIKRIVYQL